MKLKLIIGVFMLGLFFCATHKTEDIIETFDSSQDCPNILVQSGDKLKLLNKNKAMIPGVNPIYFNNLEEYTEFVEWQQSQGITCPILYFQQTYTTQGEKKYRLLPDPIEKNAGLPPSRYKAKTRQLYDASRDDPPYNRNSYAGSDPQDQNIGIYTPLDKMFHSSNKQSDSAMDVNWKGKAGTNADIKKGLFDGDFRSDIKQDSGTTSSYNGSSTTSSSYNEPSYNVNQQRIPRTNRTNRTNGTFNSSSDSAMDDNWKGKAGTNADVRKGLFDGDFRADLKKDNGQTNASHNSSYRNNQMSQRTNGMFNSGTSDSAMDINWKGKAGTNADIKQGLFDGDFRADLKKK